MDVVSGHRLWADFCASRVLGQRELSASLDTYALRYIVQHATAAEDWAQLKRALLDFDFWEHLFQQGAFEFGIVDDIAEARSRASLAHRQGTSAWLDLVGAEGAEKQQINMEVVRSKAAAAADADGTSADVFAWLSTDGEIFRRDPAAVLQRARAAPKSSRVAQAAEGFYRQPPILVLNPPEDKSPAMMITHLAGPAAAGCFYPGEDPPFVLAAVEKCAQIRRTATGEVRKSEGESRSGCRMRAACWTMRA